MPANGTITSSLTADHTAAYATAFFNEGAAYKYSRVTKIRLQLGAEPSYALCEIPIASGGDEIAPTIAGIPAGPLGYVKGGTPCKVVANLGSSQMLLMIGRVRNLTGDFDAERDEGLVEIVDDRWFLKALSLVGSFWADADGSGNASIAYREWRGHVNPKGQPNCCFRNVSGIGWVPMFCTPNFGLEANEAPADFRDPSKLGAKACLWNPILLLRYIQFATSHDAYLLVSSNYPEYPYNNQGIIWDTSWASAISESTSAMRASKERILEATNVSALCREILNEVGGYDLYMSPAVAQANGAESWANKLQIVRTRYNGGGVTFNRATSGNAGDVLADPKIITEASLHESFADSYTTFTAAGHVVFIERRVDTTTSGGIGGLIQAWGSTEQTTWLTKLRAGSARGNLTAQEAGIQDANRHEPAVGCAFRLDPGYDFQDDTTEEGKPRARVGRPILPHLLSSFVEDAAGATATDKIRFRRPVLVEYKDGSNWLVADYLDGLTLDGDGTIWLPALRELGRTYSLSGSHGSESVTFRELRLTVAIPCDHRNRASTSYPADEADDDRRDETFYRPWYGDAGQVYGKEIRLGGADADTSPASYPIPKIAGGSVTSATSTLRDDAAKLTEHVTEKAKELGRVNRGGRLVMPRVSFVEMPGAAARALKNGDATEYPLRSIIRAVEFITGEPEQRTVIELDND